MSNMFEERLRKVVSALTVLGHHDLAWQARRCADEIDRLNSIVQLLMDICKQAGTIVEAGYDCPHCHEQIVCGDSVCKVTGEQHAEP